MYADGASDTFQGSVRWDSCVSVNRLSTSRIQQVQPQALVREHLDSGALVELKPGRPLDIPHDWQHARIASSMLRELTEAVSLDSKDGLVQLE
jgi:hypothetical protein